MCNKHFFINTLNRIIKSMNTYKPHKQVLKCQGRQCTECQLQSRLFVCEVGFSLRNVEKSATVCTHLILGVHDMQQASRKAEPGDYKHAVNDM